MSESGHEVNDLVRIDGGDWDGWLGRTGYRRMAGLGVQSYAVLLVNGAVVQITAGLLRPAELEDITALDILRGAPTVLRTRGWHRGWYVDRSQRQCGVPLSQCRVCALGAMCATAGIDPEGGHWGDALNAAVDALTEVIKPSGAQYVCDWNDAASDVETVIAAIDAAAELVVAEAAQERYADGIAP